LFLIVRIVVAFRNVSCCGVRRCLNFPFALLRAFRVRAATQDFAAQLIANARSHRRFKPIEVLGQGTCRTIYRSFRFEFLFVDALLL
jgi:hypothetical protein